MDYVVFVKSANHMSEYLISEEVYDHLLEQGKEHGRTLVTDVLVFTNEAPSIVPIIPRTLPIGVEPSKFSPGRQAEIGITTTLHGEVLGYTRIFDKQDVLRFIRRRPRVPSHNNLTTDLPSTPHYHILSPDPEHNKDGVFIQGHVYAAVRPLKHASTSLENMFGALEGELDYLLGYRVQDFRVKLPQLIAIQMYQSLVTGVLEGAQIHRQQEAIDKASAILTRIPAL